MQHIIFNNKLCVAATVIIHSKRFSFRSCEIAYNFGRGSLKRTIDAINEWINTAEFDVHRSLQSIDHQ